MESYKKEKQREKGVIHIIISSSKWYTTSILEVGWRRENQDKCALLLDHFDEHHVLSDAQWGVEEIVPLFLVCCPPHMTALLIMSVLTTKRL